MKCLEIDLRDYIPLETRIDLYNNFRINIFNKIKALQLKKKIINKLSISRQTFEFWERGICLPRLSYLVKIAEMINVSKEEILINTKSFTSRFKNGSISPSSLKLYMNPKFAEWIGLIEGDGSVSKKYIECENTCFDLIFFFVDFLQKHFGIKKNQVKMIIRVPKGKNVIEAEPIEKMLIKGGFLNIYIEKMNNGINFLLISRIDSKVLSYVMKDIIKKTPYILKKSCNDIKAAYISGFASAEGGIYQNKKSRFFALSQKSLGKILFIKDLLNKLGFKNIVGPYPKSGSFEICLRKRRELERYFNKIGFGHHKIKNKKLARIVSGYLYAEYKPKPQRYAEILELVKSNNFITSSIIAEKLKIKRMHASHLLLELYRKNFLNILDYSKPYRFSKVDKNEYKTTSKF